MKTKPDVPTSSGPRESSDKREIIPVNTLKEKEQINNPILQFKELEKEEQKA